MLLVLVFTGVASAYWSAGSAPGGNGASAETTVNQGATPAVSSVGGRVTVSWAGSTLSNGRAVDGYIVKRYDAATGTLQTIRSSCAGAVAATACTESGVPAGQWAYSVTPVFATNWRGAESLRSSPVTVTPPRLTLSSTAVMPGKSLTGTAAGFIAGESLQYRLDSPTGAALPGSLGGTATPTAVPAGGGGSVVVTVPAGTSDGAHTIYAVTSPSGDTAAAGIVVDSAAPPPPTLTLTPAALTGDTVTFEYTEAEASATVDCRLDSAAFSPCTSPVDYAGLGDGPHTFQARATDPAGNVSASTSYTWIVNTNVPTVAIAFPTVSGRYNDAGFNAGCGTASTGDVCGTADDDTSVSTVNVSLRRLSDNLYWTGTAFSAVLETWLAATGTTDWTYAINSAAVPEGDYTLRAKANDGVNDGYDSRTFTVDRTAPPAPTLNSAPPPTSGPTATFAFITTDTTAGFECQRDGGAWTTCSSPQTYSNLSHGSHTVAVRAVDSAGNASAGSTTTWTVDATVPTAAVTFPVATSYNLAGWAGGCGTPSTGDICGSASDVGSGVTAVAVSIRRAATNTYWDGSAFAATNETWLAASGTTSWSYLFAGTSFPADGSYTVRWHATDAVGNAGTGGVDVTLDTVAPPTPQIVQAPSDPGGGSAQFDFTDAEAGTGAECRLDSGAWLACTAPVGYSGLASGSHTFGVRATDAAGNVSAAAFYTWTVDAGLPTISISFPDAGRAYNNATYAAGCSTPAGDMCGTASDPQGNLASVAVSIRRASTSLYWSGTSFSSPTEVFLPATGTTSWSYAMAAASFPADDGYTVRARATDGVGLVAYDTLNITIDRTAPAAPTITSGPSGTTAGSDTFTFTGEPGATFECRLDAGSWASCGSPKTYGALTDGSHAFDVRAVDGAGNAGAPASRTWTVDVAAPTVGTTFPVATGRYNNASWTPGCAAGADDMCGTASDAGGTVTSVEVALRRVGTNLYWNGTGFAASASTWLTATGTASWSLPFAATAFPADDSYVLSVRATDTTGIVSTPVATTFAIDRTGPGAASLSAINRGSTVRRIETGDQLTLTFTEAIAPSSLIAGWNGTGTQNIVVRQANNTNDALSFYNDTNATRLPLGVVQMKQGGYVTGAVVWGLAGAATRSTLTLSGATVTITFGTPDLPARVSIATLAKNMNWNPRTSVTTGTGITDLVGNLGTATGRAETDNDDDF